MKILDTLYVKELKKKSIGCEMLHLGDTSKREAKYFRFVYTYAAINQTGDVDHNFIEC